MYGLKEIIEEAVSLYLLSPFQSLSGSAIAREALLPENLCFQKGAG